MRSNLNIKEDDHEDKKGSNRAACTEAFQSLDYYGTPVQLYFKGRSDYRTTFGATVSLLSYVSLFIVTLVWAVRYYSDFNPSFTEYRKLIDMSDGQTLVKPFEHDFNIGFGMKSGPIDRKYGSLKAEYVTETKAAEPDRTNIVLRECIKDDFRTKNESYTPYLEAATKGLLCLSDSKGISIYGD